MSLGTASRTGAIALCLVCLTNSSPAAISTNGALDTTFDAGVFDAAQVTAAALQPDGKLVISGAFHNVQGFPCAGMARLNTDGTADQSFQGSGIYSHLLVQADGKILAWTDFDLARLNPDGSLDAAFNVGQRLSQDGTNHYPAQGLVAAVLLQPDGKIVVAGDFSFVLSSPGPSVARDQMARFNSDGSLDASFVPNPRAISAEGLTVVGAALQASGTNAGKIIYLWGYAPSLAYGIARLNAAGTFDSTFQSPSNGGFGWRGSGLFVQSDDRVVVFGGSVPYTAAPRNLVRLNADGTLDSSFNTEAFNEYRDLGAIGAVAQQADGKLVVAGRFHSLGATPMHGIARLDSTGTRDVTFDGTGIGAVGEIVQALLLRPTDGDIFVGGYFARCAGAVRHDFAWLNSDGSIDSAFEGSLGATDGSGDVLAMATQTDGKVLIGGNFLSVGGAPHSNLVRCNADGTVDNSFGVNFGVLGSVRAIEVQPDGKILIGGTIRAVDAVARGRIARLNADGTLDQSFDPNAADGSIHAITLDQSGNIFIGGSFLTLNGSQNGRVAKLTPAGTADPSFLPGFPSSAVRALAPPNGTSGVLVGGDFTRIGTTTTRRIARLNANTGALDISFNPGASPSTAGFSGQVLALRRAPDGSYYVGGAFSSYNGVSRTGLARLNGDGTLDGNFQSPNLGQISSLALQNGKLFAAGSPDFAATIIRRLTNTGQIDGSFDPGTGPILSTASSYRTVLSSALAIAPDGKLLLGGTFDHYNGTARSDVVRLTDSNLSFAAVSRQAHGGAASFDIALPLTGPSGIECRSGGASGAYQVVFNFGGAVTLDNATVTSGAGSVDSTTGSGTATLTVNLTNVTDAQRITLTLSNINTGMSTTDVGLQMGVLLGDTNGNGAVSASDIGQTKGQSGQPVTASNFRSDLNASGGTINASDVGQVKANAGHTLP